MMKKTTTLCVSALLLGLFSHTVFAEVYLSVIKLSNRPRCLDVRSGSYVNGNTMITFPCHIYSNQTFFYDTVAGTIAPFGAPGMYVTEETNPSTDNRIKLYDTSRAANQVFNVQVGGKMKGTSGHCWSLKNETGSVDQIVAVDCSLAVETWVIQKLQFSKELVSLNNSLCVQPESDNIAAGVHLIATTCVRKDSQLWDYDYGSGLLRMSVNTSLCLGEASGKYVDGEQALLKTCDASDVTQVVNFADGVGAYIRSTVYTNHYDNQSSTAGTPVVMRTTGAVYLSTGSRFNQPVNRIPKIEVR